MRGCQPPYHFQEQKLFSYIKSENIKFLHVRLVDSTKIAFSVINLIKTKKINIWLFKVIARATEAKKSLKWNHVFRDANQPLSNCKRISYFQHHTEYHVYSNIMYLFWGHSANKSLGKGSRRRKQQKWHRKEGMQSKKWYPSNKLFYELFFFSATQSLFLLGFP